VRERAEARTGRTIEESYEGFTDLIVNAVYERIKSDRSSYAKHRRTR
jgi:hypothetical protein